MSDNKRFGISEQLESSSCGHKKDHIADPGNMVGDLIERAAAIETVRKAKSIGQAHRMLVQLPSAQPDIPGINVIIDTIKNAINASTGNEAYMVGLRNGMRWCCSVLTDKEPEYEEIPSAQPEEPSYDAVKEYCWKRCLSIVDTALLDKYTPPAQQWIPVTDRLPERTDTYLVQVGINENGEGMHTEARTAEWNAVWQTWYVHTTHCFVGDIIKWMPIPWEGSDRHE